MFEHSIETAMARATAAVLDTMFFTGFVGDAPGLPEAVARIAVRMTFAGERCGTLALGITEGAARTLAADFLGEAADDLAHGQVEEVVRELANLRLRAQPAGT